MTRKVSPRHHPLPATTAALCTALVALVALSLAGSSAAVVAAFNCANVALTKPNAAALSTPKYSYDLPNGEKRKYWCPSPGADAQNENRVPDGNVYVVPALYSPVEAPTDNDKKYDIEIFKDIDPNGPDPQTYPGGPGGLLALQKEQRSLLSLNSATETIELSGGGNSDGSKTCGAYQVWYTPKCDTSTHILGFRYIITDRVIESTIVPVPGSATFEVTGNTKCGYEGAVGTITGGTYQADCKVKLETTFPLVCHNNPGANSVEDAADKLPYDIPDNGNTLTSDVYVTYTQPTLANPTPCPGSKVTLPAFTAASYTLVSLGQEISGADVAKYLDGVDELLTYDVSVSPPSTTYASTVSDVPVGTAPSQLQLPAGECTPVKVEYEGLCIDGSAPFLFQPLTITPTDSDFALDPIPGTLNLKATSKCDTTGSTLVPTRGSRDGAKCTTKLTYPAPTFCGYNNVPPAAQDVDFFAVWTSPTKPADDDKFCPGDIYTLSSIKVNEFVTQDATPVVIPASLITTGPTNPFKYTVTIPPTSVVTKEQAVDPGVFLLLDDCEKKTATYSGDCSKPGSDKEVPATASDSTSGTDPDVEQCGTEYTTRCKKQGTPATKGTPTLTDEDCTLSVPLNGLNACNKPLVLSPYTKDVCTCPAPAVAPQAVQPAVPPVVPASP